MHQRSLTSKLKFFKKMKSFFAVSPTAHQRQLHLQKRLTFSLSLMYLFCYSGYFSDISYTILETGIEYS